MMKADSGVRIRRMNASGQSTLEYLLVVAAILVAVIIAANAVIKPAVTHTMDKSQHVIQGAADKLQESLGLGTGSNTGGGSPPPPSTSPGG